MGEILGGSGLRVSECCKLRLNDIDVRRWQIVVRQGKGDKDRSKTLLVAESTNIFPRRCTFWAYTWGNYLLSQTMTQPRTFSGDYCACQDLGEVPTPNTPITGRSFRTCMSAWYSNHPGGMNAQLCDGSGKRISFEIDLNVFAALGSIAGEESLTGI